MDRRSFLKKLLGGGGAVVLSRFPRLKEHKPEEEEVNKMIADNLHSVGWGYTAGGPFSYHLWPYSARWED